LRARIEETLGRGVDDVATNAAPLCIDGAERLLADLLRRASTGRESALDLLTVDALVTYGLEAAAASPATLESISTDAMVRLATVARASSQSPPRQSDDGTQAL
jgi:hypothetical protein